MFPRWFTHSKEPMLLTSPKSRAGDTWSIITTRGTGTLDASSTEGCVHMLYWQDAFSITLLIRKTVWDYMYGAGCEAVSPTCA